jgi:hypothetical protein
MNPRDPKVLFVSGAIGIVGGLLLWGRLFPAPAVPPPLLSNPGPAPGPAPAPAASSSGAAPLPGGPMPAATTGLTSYLSDTFFRKVSELAAHMRSRGANVSGEDILAVLLAESDVNPSAKNKISFCAGLNQICVLSKVGWGGTLADYLALPAEQQIAFVQRYFDNVNNYPAFVDYGSLYLANFSPAFFAPPSAKIWNGHFPIMYPRSHPSYPANSGVDFGDKGFIEVADMAKFVRAQVVRRTAKWAELRMRLERATPLASV